MTAVVEPATDAPEPDAPAASSRPSAAELVVRGRRWTRDHWSVPVITLISLWIVSRQTVSFDGGLNLQVAQSLADGRGYARHYHSTILFPREIQTNGPFIFLGALAIMVLGKHNLVYQLPGVLCAALFAWALTMVIKGPYRNVLTLIVFMGLPDLLQFAFNGYGEVPVAMCELFAIVFAVRGAARRNPRLIELAFVFAGLGIVTKVVGIAVFVPLAVPVVLYFRQEGFRLSRALRMLGALVSMPVLMELYRVIGLGGARPWFDYWKDQLDAIRFQAGATRLPQLPFLDGLWQRLGTLGGAFETGRTTVVVLSVLALAILVFTAWRMRHDDARRETMLLRFSLAAMIVAYLGWWLFLTSDQKAWLRRVEIGLIFLLVAIAHLVADALAERKRSPRNPDAMVQLALSGMCLGLLMMGPVLHNTRLTVKGDRTELAVVGAAAKWVREAPADVRFFGQDWWSAPVISAYAGRDFLDLSKTDPCTLRPEGDYFVMDRYVTLIAYREPPVDKLHIKAELVVRFGDSTSIWQVMPPDDCPAA